MTQQEIIEARQKLDEQADELKAKMAILKIEMKLLGKKCKHPNRFTHYDYGGGSDLYCPDCKAL